METDPATSAVSTALGDLSENSSNARPAANPDTSSGVRGTLRRPGAGAAPDDSSRPASTGGSTGAEQGGLITRHVGRQTLTSIRRRAEAAGRAARAGDLDVLIAYDLRFWRELGGVLTNSYVCEFLDRLRVQCWAYVVPRLRHQEPLAGKLWADHCALVEAVECADADGSRHIIGDYNTHALTLAPDPGD
ncbi:FCD domain-containing protein [Streptomyces sulphureus]|uniref:FCD domain-containing protein n=1 Tax=Streptomyces sulphureus TaxID=47758 RepID=UPI001FE08AD9|nr:FCD domain-containing protein [Streptomyces sulphureus]